MIKLNEDGTRVGYCPLPNKTEAYRAFGRPVLSCFVHYLRDQIISWLRDGKGWTSELVSYGRQTCIHQTYREREAQNLVAAGGKFDFFDT